MKDLEPVTVAARVCQHCGHHELGYERPDGTFVPLTRGDEIQIERRENDGNSR